MWCAARARSVDQSLFRAAFPGGARRKKRPLEKLSGDDRPAAGKRVARGAFSKGLCGRGFFRSDGSFTGAVMRRAAVALAASGLLGLSLAVARAQLYEFNGQRVQPPAGTPICSDWYRNVALPKIGCHAETIGKICSGLLPKLEGAQATLPYCGGYEKAGYDTAQYGKTCQTTVGQCSLSSPGPLKAGCYCPLPGGAMMNGWVTLP
jgi:hypothetical protein